MSDEAPVLLIVEDDESFSRTLRKSFERRGYTVVSADGPDQMGEVLKTHRPGFAVVDLKLGGASGLACVSTLHALDPEAHPRTAENAYNIGGRELLDLVRSFESDTPVSIIYHSHPRVGAYFSEEDTNAAIAAGYPVDYLVIDAQEDEIVEAVLFRRDGDTFVKIATLPGAKV